MINLTPAEEVLELLRTLRLALEIIPMDQTEYRASVVKEMDEWHGKYSQLLEEENKTQQTSQPR